eukprot:m.35602 g.35602  ORF g.35602 m.35602 type:complete len:129 (+) comp10033_c0_seq8:825-1211(+)
MRIGFTQVIVVVMMVRVVLTRKCQSIPFVMKETVQGTLCEWIYASDINAEYMCRVLSDRFCSCGNCTFESRKSDESIRARLSVRLLLDVFGEAVEGAVSSRWCPRRGREIDGKDEGGAVCTDCFGFLR